MPVVKENETLINLKIPRDLKYQVKLQALKERTTMQSLILGLIRDYCRMKDEEEHLIIETVNEEELTEEERNAIEEGRNNVKTGNYQEMEEAFKEL
jgi:hypothetical protein